MGQVRRGQYVLQTDRQFHDQRNRGTSFLSVARTPSRYLREPYDPLQFTAASGRQTSAAIAVRHDVFLLSPEGAEVRT